MENKHIDFSNLKNRLRKVQCPYRLYPARIRALEIITNRQLQRKIDQVITSKIPQIFDSRWSEQFEIDLDTYGLYEAILYFHEYPIIKKVEPFITKACNLYHEIALLYLNHYRDIEDSDDPRIQSQLALLRFRGDGFSSADNIQFTPFTVPTVILLPHLPPPDPDYSRMLPINENAKDLGIYFKEPTNFANEVIEYFDSKFIFEGFPGLQFVFFEVANSLISFDIDPFSSTGQYIFSEICEHMEMEYYPDLTQEVECIKCSETFQAEVSLGNVNIILVQGGWLCKKCADLLE